MGIEIPSISYFRLSYEVWVNFSHFLEIEKVKMGSKSKMQLKPVNR